MFGITKLMYTRKNRQCDNDNERCRKWCNTTLWIVYARHV